MSKYGYKEVRQINMSDLRSLCIKNNWYTKGNNEEYRNLLNMTREEATTDVIIEIATDILDKSEILSDCGIKEVFGNICFNLFKICITTIEEI